LLQDTSFPRLASLFPTPPIPTQLVGRGVIAQAASSSHNTNNNNSSNNTSSKKKPKNS